MDQGPIEFRERFEHDVLFMHGLAATIIAALPTIDR